MLLLKFQLTTQPGVGLKMIQEFQQLLLVHFTLRKAVQPSLVNENVTGRTGTHSPANGGKAPVKLTQNLHQAVIGVRVHHMLMTFAVDDINRNQSNSFKL